MNSQTYKKIMKGNWGILSGKRKSKGFCNRIIRRIVGRKTKEEVKEATTESYDNW